MKILSDIRRWTVRLSLAALVSMSLVLPAGAQEQSDQDDPPVRVARLGYLEGAVSFQPAGESDWVDAVVNRPMTTGDQLWADQDSRAEVELGSAVIDLNSNTGISFLTLDDHTIQVQLSAGVIEVRVRRLGQDDDFEIDTPNQAFTILEAGRYRVEASADGSYTLVAVRDGEGEATGGGSTYTLETGLAATFEGTDTLTAETEDIPAPDDFDNWCYSRYDHFEHSLSARYVSNDVVGYEDLDTGGQWRPALGYGNVWFPQVVAGWAPYREGYWAWIDPWGWTWVDDEPWGYAPFHYGRWAWIDGQWGWIPGPMQVMPVYAPALVVFVGGGGMAFGGNIAWFPLGPQEVFVPSYPVSLGYMTGVNVSGTNVSRTTITNVYNTTIVNHTTNITQVTYANRRVAGAITAVSQQAFVSAQPVAKVVVPVNAKQLANVPVSSRAAVAPTVNSVLGARANAPGHAATPPVAVMRRAVVARKTPPPAPVSFAARQQLLAAHPGQPAARRETAKLGPANAARPMVKQAPPGRPATPTIAKPNSRPGNAAPNRPGNAAPNRPAPGNPPQPNQQHSPPQPTQPARSETQPEANRPTQSQPPPSYRPAEPPARNERPQAEQQESHSQSEQPRANQPNPHSQPNRPEQPAQRQEPAAKQPPEKKPPSEKPKPDDQHKEKPPGI